MKAKLRYSRELLKYLRIFLHCIYLRVDMLHVSDWILQRVYALKQCPIRAYTVLMILICKRKNTASINVSFVENKPFSTGLDVRKPDFVSCEQQRRIPALRICAVWSAPLLFALWKVERAEN